ncbi:hypothetical protein [Cellulomonas sp.]|uniref:hypothetical protein n=1 Tax=Cellulomonas sp. TaxID=40001 RepID=UPI002D5C0999|nr:hypothetical protein [Cellulomonas sp.]HYQ77396.1 hypothetical protein [Cellulomonas sp.]
MSDAAPEGPRVVRRAPVVLAVVPTWADTHAFPAAAVEASRPRAGRWGLGLVLGLVLGALVLAATSAVDLPGGGEVRVTCLVLGVLALAVLATHGHPAGYLVGAGIGAAGGLVAGSGAAVGVGVVCGVLAWPAWVGFRARNRWWPRLEAVLREHRRVDGRVVGSRAVSDYPPRLRTTVESPDAPGVSWTVDVQTSPRVQVAVGDPVAMWLRPADPGAGVLVLSEDVVGLAAKTSRGGGSAQQV